MSDQTPTPSPPQGPKPHDWRLLRFLLRHCLTGVIAGWALLLGFLWTDVGSIGTLTDSGETGTLGLIMLVVMFGLTGGAVAMGAAVMLLARRDP